MEEPRQKWRFLMPFTTYQCVILEFIWLQAGGWSSDAIAGTDSNSAITPYMRKNLLGS